MRQYWVSCTLCVKVVSCTCACEVITTFEVVTTRYNLEEGGE